MNKKFGYRYDKTRNVVTKNARNNHVLKSPYGWAIDKQTYEEYPDAVFEIVNTESGITYTASGAKFAEKGIHFNRNYGDQIALVMDEWHKSPINQPELL